VLTSSVIIRTHLTGNTSRIIFSEYHPESGIRTPTLPRIYPGDKGMDKAINNN
jgi:hypothetical protein